jgi:hypothetical protein
MTLRDKHQALAAKYHWMIPIVVPLLAGYFGVDQYEKYEERQAIASAPDITVTVTGAGTDHAHGAVVSQNDINTLIQRHINVVINQTNTAIAEQHAKDVALFKAKETWD